MLFAHPIESRWGGRLSPTTARDPPTSKVKRLRNLQPAVARHFPGQHVGGVSPPPPLHFRPHVDVGNVSFLQSRCVLVGVSRPLAVAHRIVESSHGTVVETISSPSPSGQHMLCQDVSTQNISPPDNSAACGSRKQRDNEKTTMCNNGPNCRFGGKCMFAHDPDDLQKMPLKDLRDKHGDKYLSHVCIHHIMCGQCSYTDRCMYLHDPSVISREGNPCGEIKVVMRATSKVPPHLVDRRHLQLINSTTQENVLVPDILWEKINMEGDMFEKTCDFIANTSEVITDIFNLPFCVQNGTEKLSKEQKMEIALLMHQKSPFSEDSSFNDHLDFFFNARSGTYLDGKNCMILQKRSFKFKVGGSGGVEEVPLQPASYDIVTVCEVVFDVKGSGGTRSGFVSCNHSLWFDATIHKTQEEALKVDVNSVHSTPYVFMAPIDDAEESHELIHSIMKHMIGRNGGPFPAELREKFFQLSAFHRLLSWPEHKQSAESAATPKSMWDHVHRPYICEGGNAEALWNSFKTNLASIHDTQAPKGSSRLSVFLRNKAGRHQVAFDSTLPRLSKDKENQNIADFLADYAQ